MDGVGRRDGWGCGEGMDGGVEEGWMRWGEGMDEVGREVEEKRPDKGVWVKTEGWVKKRVEWLG